MSIRLPRLNFRTKVVVFAVALVTVIQLGTLFPVLGEVREEQRRQADETVERAGYVYDEYMRSRTELLTLNVSTLVWDHPFRENVAGGDQRTIKSILRNHAGRAGIETAAIFDLEGNHIASIGDGSGLFPGDAMRRFAVDPNEVERVMSIAFVGGLPYHAVTVPVEYPGPIAWATLGIPIDRDFAEEIRSLTGLESTIVGFDIDSTAVYATTLPDEARGPALADVHLGFRSAANPAAAAEWITELKPYHDEAQGVYVALQLPMSTVNRSYGVLRDRFITLSGIAMLITILAAIGLSNMVTQPVSRLVEAARRMADGIYNKPIVVRSQDEFAVLAHRFDKMQEAISNRERDIVHMAHHDSLSGLPTREIVISQIRDSIGDNESLAVINFVLHRFDEIASSLGHRIADRLIQLIAGRLRDQFGADELIGHLNLPEFVLVLPGADLDQAKACVHELQAMLRSGIEVDNANISLQIRAGVSLYPNHGVNASALLRCAGIARGLASHHLGSVGIYEPGQEERSLKLIQIVGDFPRALRNRELFVEYQPKCDCETLALSGAEALVRWNHRTLGRLAPDLFVVAIEQAGGISQLTRWVLEEAVATLVTWRSRAVDTSMAVNISADDLTDAGLPVYLEALLSRNGIDPDRLTLEVTESSIMRDVESSLNVIAGLRELGCRMAIDDFGTGHSALAQLKRLPVDELKIDKSFVMNIEDRRDEAVVRTAIELGHKFGLSVVAEGVETDVGLTRLRQLGCETVQGFYFSPSLPADEFLRWAETWRQGEGAEIVSLLERPGREPGQA